jgi:multimeric flavodoxin WrbA
MKFVGSFSANMYDLRRAKEREKLILFAENYFDMIKNDSPVMTYYPPLSVPDYDYIPGKSKGDVDIGRKKMLLVTDVEDKQSNLAKMVNRFRSSFATEIETVNLHDLAIKGSCLGCIHCSYDNHCVYEGKDDFISFYESQIMGADILIYAGSVKDRYLSSTWKTFFDRSFFRGHTPSLRGKQIGFIISGPLGQIPNLRQLLTAYIEIQDANLAGFVTEMGLDLVAILGDGAGVVVPGPNGQWHQRCGERGFPFEL